MRSPRPLESILVTSHTPGASVELRSVSKSYASETAPSVVNLSLQVAPGEICTFVGPSGCGKTTTLRMVNRLVEPTSGQVLVDGQDIATGDPTVLRRRIGYVIQQTGLFPHQTIAENVATVPHLLGWDKRRVASRVDELLQLVGLDPDHVRRRYPSQLSGGERQRVGVARAVAAEPPLMLMDEPFGAVDPIVRERLQDEFLALHAKLGMTVLFVTHDVDEALKMGNRVAVMQQGGHLAQFATPAEILSAPANDFVAQFVGADRALKHLALLTVRAADIEPPDGASYEGLPRLTRDTNLRDALSALLTANAPCGVVVDSDGRTLGTLSLAALQAALDRSTADSVRAARAAQ